MTTLTIVPSLERHRHLAGIVARAPAGRHPRGTADAPGPPMTAAVLGMPGTARQRQPRGLRIGRGIAHADLQLLALAHQLQLDGAAFGQARDAVQHGVLHQRLQYPPRQWQVPRQWFGTLPLHLQALAQAQRFN
ncbi:hypothetical protein G6F58_013472 [Rhizopus delemar]|nr:hypothetical protein G6F58_013472 [Rhizopus delemar]